MINFIKAAKTFLTLFYLKLEDKKIDELADELVDKNKINVLSTDGNVVGNIYYDFSSCRFCIILKDRIIYAKSYKNKSIKDEIDFRYEIIDTEINKNVLSGVYKSKKENSKLVLSNRYELKDDRKQHKKYNFNSKKGFELYDEMHKMKICYKEEEFMFSCPLYKITIKKFPNIIYCEKIYNKNSYRLKDLDDKLDRDTFVGYEVNYGETNFISEILKILEELSPRYFDSIEKIIDASNNSFYGLFKNSINIVIDDLELRKVLITKKDFGSSKTKKEKKKK